MMGYYQKSNHYNNFMHFIKSIISIQGHVITVMFDKNEKRRIDFESIIKEFPILKEQEIFNLATLDEYPTIKWENYPCSIGFLS